MQWISAKDIHRTQSQSTGLHAYESYDISKGHQIMVYITISIQLTISERQWRQDRLCQIWSNLSHLCRHITQETRRFTCLVTQMPTMRMMSAVYVFVFAGAPLSWKTLRSVEYYGSLSAKPHKKQSTLGCCLKNPAWRLTQRSWSRKTTKHASPSRSNLETTQERAVSWHPH